MRPKSSGIVHPEIQSATTAAKPIERVLLPQPACGASRLKLRNKTGTMQSLSDLTSASGLHADRRMESRNADTDRNTEHRPHAGRNVEHRPDADRNTEHRPD